jgi:hypothetical protein
MATGFVVLTVCAGLIVHLGVGKRAQALVGATVKN